MSEGSTITAHRGAGNVSPEANSRFPDLLLILGVPEPVNINNAAMYMNSGAHRAHSLYRVSPYGGTVKSTEFEWDEMNDPLLS